MVKKRKTLTLEETIKGLVTIIEHDEVTGKFKNLLFSALHHLSKQLIHQRQRRKH